MEVLERIKSETIVAMKAGPEGKLRLATLRLVSSELKNAEIAKGGQLTEEEVAQVLSRELKRRREAAEEYEKAGRGELAAKERAEGEVVAEFMPEQMSEDEVRAVVAAAIAESGASGPVDMGRVMGAVMPKVKGKADGRLVNALVKSLLDAV